MKASKAKKAPTFSPHEWDPLDKAFSRIMASIGEPMLATRDLYQDLCGGRLESLRRQPLPDGTVLEMVLTRLDWKQWTLRWRNEHTLLGVATIVIKVIDRDNKAVDGVFFVRRAGLDKHYPATMPMPTADDAKPSQRHKPGPKPEGDWPTLMAAELIRIALDDHRRGMLANVDGLVRYMCEGDKAFLKKQLGWVPKDREAVRKKIVSFLQFVPR